MGCARIFSSSNSPGISYRSFPCIAPRVPHGISSKVPPVISLPLVGHWGHYDPDRLVEFTLRQRGKRYLMHEEGYDIFVKFLPEFLLGISDYLLPGYLSKLFTHDFY